VRRRQARRTGLHLRLRQPLGQRLPGGLVYSAVSNTCAMAAVLGKLPCNRRSAVGYDLDAELAALHK
jgi:hypothetical protein